MKSTLPATHLLRHFLLFLLTVMFLLTLIRAAYGLWQYPKLAETDALVPLFVQGLRFDLALVGIICLIPVVAGSLLAALTATRSLAKLLITVFLVGGLLLILLMELLTPWFVQTVGLRPDLELLAGVEHPMAVLQSVVAANAIPLSVAALLCILILIAFWSRLEPKRFLRYRLSLFSGLFLGLAGGLLCVTAIWSTLDFRSPALSPGASLISRDATVNDLALNTTYKTLYSMVLPLMPVDWNAAPDTAGDTGQDMGHNSGQNTGQNTGQ